MKVVVQNNMVERHTGPLAEAARRLDMSIIDISYQNDMHVPDINGPAFVYGSVGFAAAWREKRPDLISWDEHLLSPACWRKHVPLFLNADGHECRFRDVPAGWHARPMVNAKAFNGGVDVQANVPTDMAVWVSPPKLIKAEARTWLVNGEPVATRFYRGKGVAFDIPKIWLPFPDVVADWGFTDDGIKLIEFNSINTSGWYGEGVPLAVLRALQSCQIVRGGQPES